MITCFKGYIFSFIDNSFISKDDQLRFAIVNDQFIGCHVLSCLPVLLCESLREFSSTVGADTGGVIVKIGDSAPTLFTVSGRGSDGVQVAVDEDWDD